MRRKSALVAMLMRMALISVLVILVMYLVYLSGKGAGE